MDFATLKDWNVHRTRDQIRRQHLPGGLADFTKVRCQIEAGEISGSGRAALQLRSDQPIMRCLVIGAKRIGALHAGFEIGDGKGHVGSLVGQFKFLAGRQSDHAGQGDFLLGEIIHRRDQLLLARLVFDLSAECVDGRRDSGLLLRNRLVVERLRRHDLRLRGFDAGCSSNRLQISVAGREHDQIARILQVVLGHAFAKHGRTVFLHRLPVEVLRGGGAHVKVGERSDDRRDARKQRTVQP